MSPPRTNFSYRWASKEFDMWKYHQKSKPTRKVLTNSKLLFTNSYSQKTLFSDEAPPTLETLSAKTYVEILLCYSRDILYSSSLAECILSSVARLTRKYALLKNMVCVVRPARSYTCWTSIRREYPPDRVGVAKRERVSRTLNRVLLRTRGTFPSTRESSHRRVFFSRKQKGR